MFPGRSHLLTIILLLAACSFSISITRASSMDVVLVVDTSGSMAWDVDGLKKTDPKFQGRPRIDLVIDALKNYAEKLPPGTRLRLISFNSGVKTNREFVVSEENRAELVAAIGKLKGEVGSGDTWLWEAMREGIAAAEAYAAQDPDLTVTLYVLTDGEYDNKTSTGDISLAKVLADSKSLGGESLYGSLVLLGKRKSQGGAFRDEYLEQLEEEAGAKCDVQLDEDFNPLFPAILDAPERALPGAKTKVYEVSGGNFSKVEWMLDGKVQPSKQRNLEFIPPKPGRYIVTFKGFDSKDRRARARIALDIGQTPVKALPEIYIDGKPLKAAGRVIRGQVMSLTHNSEGPVKRVKWRVNDKVVSDEKTLTQELDQAGKYKISLTVESAPDPAGNSAADTSAVEVVEVFEPSLEAMPEIASVDGKPFSEAGPIHPGSVLTLASKNPSYAERFEWEIGETKLSGPTVNWPVPEAGTFEIIHTVVGAASGNGTAPKDTATISVTAVDQKLDAVASVRYRGRPVTESSSIYVGETLQLVSESTGPVQSAVWTVNGREIAGNSVSYPISEPGEIEISLKVLGRNPGQTDESIPDKLLAKKRPPVWMLWALILAQTGVFAFFAWLLTGNQVGNCRLVVTNGPRPPVRKFFSRFSKTAVIPFNKMLKSKEYWKKSPDRDALVISRQSVAKGPAVKLACTFAPARRGTSDVQFGESKAATTTERFYLLEDARNPDEPQTVEFTLQAGKKSAFDTVMLAAVAVSLAAAFFWFYLKIYPAL